MSQQIFSISTEQPAMRDAATRLVDATIAELPPGTAPEMIAITAMLTCLHTCESILNKRPPQAGITVLANVAANTLRAMAETAARRPGLSEIPRELLAASFLDLLSEAQQQILSHVMAQDGDVTRMTLPKKEAS